MLSFYSYSSFDAGAGCCGSVYPRHLPGITSARDCFVVFIAVGEKQDEISSFGIEQDRRGTADGGRCAGLCRRAARVEVFVAARAYLGKPTDDFSKSAIAEAAQAVNQVRPQLRYFHSSQYINDLANGDTCVAHGYSGDLLQARDRASEAGNGVEIAYVVPAEGAVVWTDVMAIPKDAPNPAAAHKFIDYLLQPQVIAEITNYVAYANANAAATDLVDEAIRSDTGIYPPAQTLAKLLVLKTPCDKQARAMNRAWTRVKTGQ